MTTTVKGARLHLLVPANRIKEGVVIFPQSLIIILGYGAYANIFSQLWWLD
ncbi:hypothetical protein HY486_02995 [Candidatus Woesearchaeota archaeon]|nr:hypothetical protein [Candidatus Woesearchaeota archaeon]